MDTLKGYIVDVPDFPKKGVLFKDITPLLEDPKAFHSLIQTMGQHIPKSVTKLVGVESRGFILASALAFHMGKGLVLCRKPGKLPREKHAESYDLEYGTDSLELHKSSLSAHDQVLIVDDVLATGGTAAAVAQLCEKSNAHVEGFLFLMEIGFLKGSTKLKQPVQSLFTF